MNWNKDYISKTRSLQEALNLIESGDVILTQNGVAMPCALIEGLYDIRDRVNDVEINLGVTKRNFRIFNKECNGKINVRTNFLYPGERAAISDGSKMQILLIDLHDTFEDKRDNMRANVAFAGVSGPDENGYFSMGLHGGDIPALKDSFEKIIVQVNNNSPFVYGEGNLLHVSDVTAIVEYSEPLQQLPVSESNPLDEKIASYIVDRIPDGATLQFGVGGPGMAIGRNLKHKKDLGIHTEMFCDTMVDLLKCGAANNSKKKILPGISVFGFCQGEQATYDYINKNKLFECRSFSWVNDPFIIGQNDNVISINSAIAVDLTGQVCAESIGLKQYSGTGGHCDFVRGARISRGGQSFIAFYSTFKDKSGSVRSKIDLTLPLGSAVTTRRNDVHCIVTEYGIADLRYSSIEERAKKMINIAHPDFRDELTYKAKKFGLIY